MPAGRFHWPEKSGYLPKSTIWAWVVGANETAKDVAKAVVRAATIGARIFFLHRAAPSRGACFARRLPQFRGDAEGGASRNDARTDRWRIEEKMRPDPSFFTVWRRGVRVHTCPTWPTGDCRSPI